MQVRGGGFTLWTDDPVMIAVVKRCDDLKRENDALVAALLSNDRKRLPIRRST